MSPIYVSPCMYDPNFWCHVGCKDLRDRPRWCVHKEELYQKALEEEPKIRKISFEWDGRLWELKKQRLQLRKQRLQLEKMRLQGEGGLEREISDIERESSPPDTALDNGRPTINLPPGNYVMCTTFNVRTVYPPRKSSF